MSRETLKVLEMVADGRISPDEGERLIMALEAKPTRGRGGSAMFEIPDIKIPKIDMGQLGDLAIELKNTIVEGAKQAQGSLRKGKAKRFFNFKDYPISVTTPGDINRCSLNLELRAGKLKLKGAELENQIIVGKIKRIPEEPVLISEVKDGKSEITLKHSLGRCNLRASDSLIYNIALDNAAADSSLVLTELEVETIEIDNNAGNVSVLLGDKSDRVAIGIKNNAGNVELLVPESHAIRLTLAGSLSSHNLEKYGLEVVDGLAASSDWDDNAKGVDIVLKQNVASFALKWKRRGGATIGDDEDEG